MLAMTESCLNSRPLTPMSQDPNDLGVLTPGHFLIGTSLQSLPTEKGAESIKIQPTLNTRWKLLQAIVNSFWARWSKEYLSNLQRRPKWKLDTEPLQVADLVLIKEDKVAPLHWPRAPVLDLFTRNDGTARVARLQTANSILNRPKRKLVKLLLDKKNY